MINHIWQALRYPSDISKGDIYHGFILMIFPSTWFPPSSTDLLFQLVSLHFIQPTFLTTQATWNVSITYMYLLERPISMIALRIGATSCFLYWSLSVESALWMVPHCTPCHSASSLWTSLYKRYGLLPRWTGRPQTRTNSAYQETFLDIEYRLY